MDGGAAKGAAAPLASVARTEGGPATAALETSPKVGAAERRSAEGLACRAPTGAPCSPAGAPYAEGRLVVKLRGGLAEPADVVHASGMTFAASGARGGDHLDRLAAEYRVSSVTPLFAHMFAGAAGEPGRGAAAERRRRFVRFVSDARARFAPRTARAPADAGVPDLTNVYVLEVPAGTDLRKMARDYAADPDVEYAAPDEIAHAEAATDDPYLATSGSWGQTYGDLWGLHKIGAPAAWDLATGNGVVVAVVDTGLDYTHPDIAANAWANAAEVAGSPRVDDDGNGYVDDVRGWDFAYGDADPMDGAGHGTHVSGTIAAVGDNGVGVVGVAYQATIMPVKGLDNSGYGTESALALAITYAASNGADVVNNSWGCSGCTNPVVIDAIAAARSLGCVVTAAAGNDGADVLGQSPANIEGVLTVSSSGADDSRSWFSSWGYLVDVAAPGGGPDGSSPSLAFRNVLSLRAAGTGDSSLAVGTRYLRQAGTSMSTPHVSGVAALLLSRNPALSVGQVESIVRHAAADQVGDPELDVSGYDVYYGWGRLDAAAAVAAATSPPDDPPILRVVDVPLSFDVPQSSCGGTWSLPLDVYNLGGGSLAFSASGPEWLTLTPASGTTHSTVAASIDSLASRSGTLTITAPGAVGSPVDLAVTQQVMPAVALVGCPRAIAQAPAAQEWDPEHNSTSPPGISDGAGGAIVMWLDTRNNNPDLYMQRIDSDGNPLWYANGLPFTMIAPGAELDPAMLNDGSGGIFVTYTEGPNSMYADDRHIRIQRVDSTGQKLWGTDGVWVCRATGGQVNSKIAPDGAGGAIVVWQDYRNGATADVYAQRFDSAGTPLWQANGRPVSLAVNSQFNPVIAPDGSGGAIITWVDSRTNYWAIWAQRIDSSGNPLWAENGIMVAPQISQGPNILSDGEGGAIIAWYDFRNLPLNPSGATSLDRADLYAARLDGTGRHLWALYGVPVVEGLYARPSKLFPWSWAPNEVTMTADARGGAFLVWHDSRNGTWDIYAQRIDLQGNPTWTANGVPVATATGQQATPFVVPDGDDGAVFVWSDYRAGSSDLFLQRLGPTGDRLWGAGGTWLLGKPGHQAFPSLVPLANGRFLVTWDDYGSCDAYSCSSTGIDFFGAVISTNRAPVEVPQSVTVEEDSTVAVTLSATDADGDALTYAVSVQPAHGTLAGTPPDLTYAPAPDYDGADALEFTASDGKAESNAATVSITVTPVNDAPVATAFSQTVAEDGSVALMLSATDVDGDLLTYSATEPPAHGTLTGTAPDLTYVPAADYHGDDSFTFFANDGTIDSAMAAVSITVSPVNDAPVATPQSVTLAANGSATLTLAASDVDGDTLTFALAALPEHGTLSGVLPGVVYTPAQGWSGTDSFEFVANDGTVNSARAAATMTVEPAPPPPSEESGCGCGAGGDPASLAFLLAWIARRRALARRGARAA